MNKISLCYSINEDGGAGQRRVGVGRGRTARSRGPCVGAVTEGPRPAFWKKFGWFCGFCVSEVHCHFFPAIATPRNDASVSDEGAVTAASAATPGIFLAKRGKKDDLLPPKEIPKRAAEEEELDVAAAVPELEDDNGDKMEVDSGEVEEAEEAVVEEEQEEIEEGSGEEEVAGEGDEKEESVGGVGDDAKVWGTTPRFYVKPNSLTTGQRALAGLVVRHRHLSAIMILDTWV